MMKPDIRAKRLELKIIASTRTMPRLLLFGERIGGIRCALNAVAVRVKFNNAELRKTTDSSVHST